jgi:NAD(P)-dependent dehydrogenase (short-subunit alcohol dehydrogenase family)
LRAIPDAVFCSYAHIGIRLNARAPGITITGESIAENFLEGKVALVTGGARGLGLAHAQALSSAGARLVVNDLGGSADGDHADDGPAHDAVQALNARGGEAVADTSDVSSWEQAGRLVAKVVGHFGRLDIIVNNAGICRPTEFGRIDERDWDRLLDVNAKGMAAVIDAAARHWREQGPMCGRAIVNTASPGGPHPSFPLGIYGVSKAAVVALTQVAAAELAPLGVRVNGLAPVARTRMVAAAMAGRAEPSRIMPCDSVYDLFEPAHIARLVLYLVSPLCRFTGRLFGVRADDIFVYSEWDARHHVGNGARSWSLDALAAAMTAFPTQEEVHLVGPCGSHPLLWPTAQTLTSLAAAAAAN